MKKTILAVFCSLSCSLALAADNDGSQVKDALIKVNASKLIAPIQLDNDAKKIAQTRMNDAMNRMNEKLSKQFEQQFHDQMASIDP